MSHTLIVLPDDTAKPILEPINAAKHALNIRMFLFTDPTLLDAVIAAHHRGVNVRVMLNPARRSGESENEEARKRSSPPASRCATATRPSLSRIRSRWSSTTRSASSSRSTGSRRT